MRNTLDLHLQHELFFSALVGNLLWSTRLECRVNQRIKSLRLAFFSQYLLERDSALVVSSFPVNRLNDIACDVTTIQSVQGHEAHLRHSFKVTLAFVNNIGFRTLFEVGSLLFRLRFEFFNHLGVDVAQALVNDCDTFFSKLNFFRMGVLDERKPLWQIVDDLLEVLVFLLKFLLLFESLSYPEVSKTQNHNHWEITMEVVVPHADGQQFHLMKNFELLH